VLTSVSGCAYAMACSSVRVLYPYHTPDERRTRHGH
jgi:hypothetical protein